MFYRISVLITFLSSFIYCQSQFDYPLHVGDVWEYSVEGHSTFRKEITQDSTLDNGKTYYLVSPGESFFRQQGDSVFHYSPTSDFSDEYLLFDFSATPGDTITELYYSFGDTFRVICESQSMRQIFGQTLESWVFFVDEYAGFTDDETRYTVVNTIGISYQTSPLGPYYELRGARIGGIRYGVLSALPGTERPLKGFELYPNYPNPFNPKTEISFSLEGSGIIQLSIYNIQGKLICNLANGHFVAGTHKIGWNGTNNLGQDVGSGVYFYVLSTETGQLTRKMLLVQ